MTSNGGTPSKPWEINRGQTPSCCVNNGNLRSSAETASPLSAPPIPTRPSQRVDSPLYRPTYGSGFGYGNSYGGYGSYGSGLGGYGGMYGNGSMYGTGGMYGGSYRSYGTPNGGGFTRQAEESTRQAFQSVESIVRAFTSVSTMLESTLGAVYSSFRAVLDVADHFSRVKATFTDILSSITIFRFLRYLYRRVLSILKLRNCDEAWEAVTPDSGAAKPHVPKEKKSWPIMLFVAVVIGGPYLIWKLLRGSNSDEQKESSSSWLSGEGDHVIAQAEYDFQGTSDEELSFKAGERIILAPRDIQPDIRGWLLGTMDGKTPGYLPANYVKILGLRKGRSQQQLSQQAQTSQQPQITNNTSTEQGVEEEWKNIHGQVSTAPDPPDDLRKEDTP